MKDLKKLVRDFWYGKPAEEMRMADLYIQPTGLYKHREWRGVKDTFYYMYMIWGYNYLHMVMDVMRFGGGLIPFVKGLWRYRWMGQTYIPVLHWFDRGLEGLRGPALRGSAWHYRAMVCSTIRQFQTMFQADTKLHGGKKNDHYYHTIAHKETFWGGIFYGWSDKFIAQPLEMIPYFVTCHVNSHVVLNYIDAAQSIGLPGDPCPMCQAEEGIFVLDDVPDYSPIFFTCNEACDGSVASTILQDWFWDKPLFAFPMTMQFDNEEVMKNSINEIKQAWAFMEEHSGVPMNWDLLWQRLKEQNELMRFEWEKWDVAANTDSYPICGVAQALYRIYQSQYGTWGENDIWHQTDRKVRPIMEKAVANKINTFPKTRHRVIAWSCAPLYYSNWCSWAYNAWGLNVIINMDSLMFNMEIRTDSKENTLYDMAKYHLKAPMRNNAVGGLHHILELWMWMERFNCDMVAMYDQLQCKGMQGVHGLFEDEFRERNIHAFWVPHALPDCRTVSRAEIRGLISDYMATVMGEEPIDPSLLDFDDSQTW